MSLLNEMLHDLAKQKTRPHHATVFSTLPPRKKSLSMPNIALASIMVISVCLFFYLSHKQKKISPAPAIEMSKAPIDTTKSISIVAPLTLSASPQEEAPITDLSYIEPIDSPTSTFTVLEGQESDNDWALNSQANEWADISDKPTVKIKKIYAPQTLDEWRNAQLNKALKAIDEGLDDKAIALLQQILDKIPTASDARENLAVLYLYNDDYVNAAKMVSEGLKYAPANAALITIKARLSLDKGKAEQAVKILSEHKPSMSSYPDYYATLAAALQSQGRLSESGGIYKALLQVEPNNAQYWLGYAIALEHHNKMNEAMQAYNQASQKSDNDPSVREYAEDRLKTLQG